MDTPNLGEAITRDGEPAREPTRTVVAALERSGMSRIQARNLVALASGLAPVAGGWSVTEIDHLQFVRWLVDNGRLHS
jgi:hypothetical protein